MNLLVDFVGLGALILIHVSNLIFPYMVANSYESAKYIIPMCILAAIINVISGFMGQIYAALKATKIIVYSTFSACILNVVIVPFFCFTLGFIGSYFSDRDQLFSKCDYAYISDSLCSLCPF